MTQLGLILLAFATNTLQAVEAPLVLPPAARVHLPAGWKVIKVAQVDLNADGVTDLVIFREEADPKKITKRDDGYELNGNPRTVVVLPADKEVYRKVGEYPKFISPAYTSEFDPYLDRFADLKVAKSVISIKFNWFASAGSWQSCLELFKFRLEGGTLRLIGIEKDSFCRNSGEKTLTSTKQLTGKHKIIPGLNEFDDQPSHPNTTWENIESLKPIYLEDMPTCGRKD